MKKLLISIALFFTVASQAQVIPVLTKSQNLEVSRQISIAGKVVRKISTDTLLSENSATSIPTEKAVKAYMDNVAGTYINIKKFGAKGDGVTDDKAALQAAINASPTNVIYLPAGTYKVSGQLNFNAQTKIIGAGRGLSIIDNTDSTKYLFSYLTTSGAVDAMTDFLFQNITIRSKYGIRVNESVPPVGTWPQQTILKGGVIRSVEFRGSNMCNVGDPNKFSAIIPSQSSLENYGIAVKLNKVFNCTVENCEIQFYGVAIILDGCDLNKIDNNRFLVNSRHIYSFGHDTFGSQNQINHNDATGNLRIPAFFLDYTMHHTIIDNYFETYYPSGQFIRTESDEGTLIIGNRVDDNTTATPFFSLNPKTRCIVTNNRYNGTNTTPMELRNTAYTPTHKNRLLFVNNAPQFKLADVPATLGDLKFGSLKYNNYSDELGGTAANGFPWIKSVVTNRWVCQTLVGTLLETIYMSKAPYRYDSITCYIMGRYVSPGGGFIVVSYTEDAVTTSLFANFIGFTDSTKAVQKSITFRIPPNAKGDGKLNFEIVNDGFEFESLFIKPLN